ncbi:MAG: nicotinate (nicotinamide) nucleotide adenylyltransferase [Mariprofundaceae bacterium]
MKRLVGVFGGSFDPPHLGHLALVKAALAQLPVQEIWVIPVGSPVHKELSGCADGMTRVDWLRRMFDKEANVHVLDWEVHQHTPTPAISTLRWIAKKHADVMPVWLMGTDSFAGLSSWVEYPAHRYLCSMAVFTRAGYSNENVPKPWCVGDVGPVGNIQFVDVDISDVSATKVRERMFNEESLKGLVCESIREEIEALYTRARRKSG